jgi:hypothetical protein
MNKNIARWTFLQGLMAEEGKSWAAELFLAREQYTWPWQWQEGQGLLCLKVATETDKLAFAKSVKGVRTNSGTTTIQG